MDIYNVMELLKQVKPFIERAHDDAEARHDNYGELYMNDADYAVMCDTRKLAEEIDRAISEFST